MNDILVFTPVYRLEPETIVGIFALEGAGPISVLFQRDNPSGNGRLDHLHQYQRGRELFLSGSFSHMLVIESDIIPPPDTLVRLLEMDVDLAYGCYVFRASPVVNVFEKYYADRPKKKAQNIGQSLSVRGLWPAACEAGIVECSGGGLGCVLIKRQVLAAIDFRIDEAEKDRGPYADSYFTRDVYAAGFTMQANTFVLCGHKDEDGEILEPHRVMPL